MKASVLVSSIIAVLPFMVSSALAKEDIYARQPDITMIYDSDRPDNPIFQGSWYTTPTFPGYTLSRSGQRMVVLLFFWAWAPMDDTKTYQCRLSIENPKKYSGTKKLDVYSAAAGVPSNYKDLPTKPPGQYWGSFTAARNKWHPGAPKFPCKLGGNNFTFLVYPDMSGADTSITWPDDTPGLTFHVA